MAVSSIEWPNPPPPKSIKALLIKLYEIADSRAENSSVHFCGAFAAYFQETNKASCSNMCEPRERRS